jgi:HEAT repeat protein
MQWWQWCCCAPVLVSLLGLAVMYWVRRPPNVVKLQARNDVQGLVRALGYERGRIRRPVGAAAAQALTLMGDAAVESLITALHDSNKYLAEQAAQVLGQIGDERAFQPLLTILEDREQEPEVRRAAINALAALDAARAVEPLIRILERQEHRWDRYVRPEAARVLGRIGDERAVEPLIAAFSSAGDLSLHRATAGALEKVGDQRALAPLIAALGKRYEDEDTLRSVIWALARIGDPQAVEPLIGVLEHTGLDVERDVAGALGRIGAQAVEPLIAAFQSEDEYRRKYTRRYIAEALGMTGNPRAVESLLAALPNEDLRLSVINALGYTRDPRAVEPLIADLEDQDKSVRGAAAKSLGKIGDPRAIKPLQSLAFDDPEPGVRHTANKALEELHVKSKT